MPVNVRPTDRDQLFLMPPSVADWLPEDHLAWFIIDVVAELDLAEFYAAYREDGRGGAAYDPARVARRPSLRLLRRENGPRGGSSDVSPTTSRSGSWRQTNTRTTPRWRGSVVVMWSPSPSCSARCSDCASKKDWSTSGIIAIDGTKMEANASSWSNRTRRQFAEEILAEAERTDAAEDERFGKRRGDELPERLAPGADRRSRVREALRQLDAAGAGRLRAP